MVGGIGGFGGRKLGGILIETVATGARRLAVIGIGLNVLPQTGLHAAETSSGVACLQELHAAVTAPEALATVALPLVQALLRFERDGLAPFSDAFARRDLLRDRVISTSHADHPEGIARGVQADGSLTLDTPAGRVQLHSGEVSVRPRRTEAAGHAAERAC